MNKAELVNAIESKLGGRKAATDALEAVLDVIIREVAKGGKVAITGFGTFQKVAREARTGRNPRTGETVRIDRTTVPRFRPGTSFKVIVADPRRLPVTAPAATRASARKDGEPAAAKVNGSAPPAKAAAKKTTAKGTSANGSARKAPAKKASAATTGARKATASKTTASKTTARKTTARKTTARKTTAKATAAKAAAPAS